MRNLALMCVLAAACLLGCGGKDKDAKNKAVSAADTAVALPDTVASVFDTTTTFTDSRDGKVYRIVKIGRQVWFAENLNYAAKGSKCYKNSADSCAKYGRLYNWETALKACPAGTHLPSDAEWMTLTDNVGGRDIASKKLKSTEGWNDNGNGTNDYQFSALPGSGIGYSDSFFRFAGINGNWWSATEYDAYYVWSRNMNFYREYVRRFNNDKYYLFSVRCVVDNEKEAQK